MNNLQLRSIYEDFLDLQAQGYPNEIIFSELLSNYPFRTETDLEDFSLDDFMRFLKSFRRIYRILDKKALKLTGKNLSSLKEEDYKNISENQNEEVILSYYAPFILKLEKLIKKEISKNQSQLEQFNTDEFNHYDILQAYFYVFFNNPLTKEIPTISEAYDVFLKYKRKTLEIKKDNFYYIIRKFRSLFLDWLFSVLTLDERMILQDLIVFSKCPINEQEFYQFYKICPMLK